MTPPLFLAALLLAVPALVHAQADPTSRSWNQPVEPDQLARERGMAGN